MTTTLLTDAQIAKLPKYAQQEIARLCSDLEDWKAQATAGPDESDTFVRRSWDRSGMQPLGRGERVEFHGPRGTIEVHVTQHGVDVTTRHGDPLVVLPRSTNRIELEVER